MKQKSLRTLEALAEHQLINSDDLPNLEKVVEEFSVSITAHMQKNIDKNNPHDPIAKQFIPHVDELNIADIERNDPIGDAVHTKIKGIIHRYPDRCLFLPVHVCPVYCRFCFRKEKVGPQSATLTPQEINNAFSYIEQHHEIWEVIITGGEPLILKPDVLKKYIARLSAIKHVQVIRIHTRVPVVDPTRINAEMIAALQTEKAMYIVLHANHAQEFTAEAARACQQIVNAGIPMLSQTLLLKNLNDDIEVLSELMRCFIRHRIKPYYLHHADLVRGTTHFRTSIAEGQRLMRQLRGRFSGLCQPTYVLDIPGGFGKAPIGPNYLQNTDDGYLVEDYLGVKHLYPLSKE